MKVVTRWLLAALCAFGFTLPVAAQTVVTLSNQYSSPQYVAVNADKTVFVTDTTNALSALFLVNGVYTNTPTAYDTNFDGLFDNPQGVAVDRGGDVFAVNNLSGSLVGLWEFRPPDYANVFALSTNNDGGLVHGDAVDSHGNFFVADSNAFVFEITSPLYDSAFPISVGQSGTDHPFGIAFDSHDNLFVADQLSGSGQIVELTAASGYGAQNAITSGNLKQPVGVAVDTRGNLYVTDSALNTLTELMAPDYTTAAVIDSTHFSGPMGVAIDADDNIFVVDTGHNALKEIPAQPAVTALVATAGPVAGGNVVTITGVHLTGAAAVSFGGGAASAFTVVSDTQVTATAPTGSAGVVDVRVTTANGTSVAAPADKYTYIASPTVGSLSPASGPTAGGGSVTITGTNLAGASAVSFGAAPASSFTVLGATQITATAPAGSAGTVDIRVTTVGGTSATGSADNYTYVSAPVVTGLSTIHGPIGGGTTVTINGSGFTGATAVKFGATAATGFTVVSDTQVTATAPAGTAGAVDVTVTTIGGTSAPSAADAFIYVAVPLVSGLSPASGPTIGGTPVVITGSNFRAASTVTFGATAAISFTVNSATQITAIAPAGSAGTVDVTVTTTGGTSATNAADQYTYLSVPVVSALNPMHGPTAGGATVTITGSAFTNVTAVRFGATAATSFTVVSATEITATAPPGSAGAVDVTVATPAGTSATSAADVFTYVAAPAVNGLSPASGPASGGTSVVITGVNLRTASAVTFGGTAATVFTVNSATQITATAPPGSVGTVDVTVTSLGGTSATAVADQFTYLAAPAITLVRPSLGPTRGGTTVAITGSGFTGATAVVFGTAAANTVSVVNDRRITVTAPAHDAGQVDVKVTTPNGTTAVVAGDSFTYVAPPIAGAVTTTIDHDSTANTVPLALTGGPASSVLVAAAPAHGTTTVNGITIQYTPAAGYVGADSFTYRAKNLAGTSAAAKVSITVQPPDATVLYRFKDGRDGAFPVSPPVIGAGGTLYGTITATGNIFSLTPPATTPGAWQFRLLRSFAAPVPRDGNAPAGLFFDDTSGALYGTTGDGRCVPGNPTLCGMAYELVPPNTAHGGSSFDALYRFHKGEADADNPISPLITGTDGALYGMSAPVVGSAATFGAVFRLAPPAKAGGVWTETVLYSFKGGADGTASAQALLIDQRGNLYGVTAGTDAFPGSVFQLSPPASGQNAWTRTVLHRFHGPNGAFPSSPLIADNTGALYGVTLAGGTPRGGSGTGSGVVYKLTPPSSGTAWTESVLYRFAGGQDGAAPMGPIVFETSGAIDGATKAGGSGGFGSVFRLTPPARGAAWSATLLHSFKGDRDGGEPQGGVVLGSDGALYGETRIGGLVTTDAPHGAGTIYRIVLSGP